MKRVQDSVIDDMFLIPQPERPEPGSSDYAFEVSIKVSKMLKSCTLDRYEIAAQMSRLTGKDISKNMIDAWASPARTDHNIPHYLVAVLEEVITCHELTDWLVHKRGGRVAYGRDTLTAKLGKATLKKQKLREEEQVLDAEIKQIKNLLGDDQ